MNEHLQSLLQQQLLVLGKQVEHLQYSRNRAVSPIQIESPEMLECCEAMTARFARLQDSFPPAFRTLALLELENNKAENMLDLLLLMEKYRILSSVEKWKNMRELRNSITHEYWQESDALCALLQQVRDDAQVLFNTLNTLEDYVQKRDWSSEKNG